MKAPPSKQRRPVQSLFAALFAALAAGMAFAGGSAFAAAGDLDRTFDGDGKAVLPFGGHPEEVMVQRDGKIVIAGTLGSNFAAWRLNPDGSLDSSFDGDGTAVADFGGNETGLAAALQADGKIVVAGNTHAQTTQVAVARLNTDGTLDKTFDPGGPDGDGKKAFSDGVFVHANAVVIQPDGAIVVAGGGYGDFNLVRLTPAGSIEKSFDYADFGGYESVRAAALGADGKVVVVGPSDQTMGVPGGSVTAVARYNGDGSLDRTLGGTGKATFGSGDPIDPQGLQVQPDGKIIVAGSAGAADPTMAATRLNLDGSVDTTFGRAGRSTADFAGEDHAAAAALRADGKLLVAGTTSAGYSFAVARFDERGTLDTGFGAGGKTTIPVGDISLAYSAALQPDGKLLVAGQTLQNGFAKLALVRLLGDPAPDSGDGPGGGDPGSGPGVDRDAPVIGGVTLTPAAFAVARRGTALAAARGTTIRYTLSEPATVTLRFRRAAAGRRVGRACRPITSPTRKRRPCRRYVTAGTLRRAGRPGANRVTFSGRIGRRALRPGAYRLVVSGVDAAGNRATARPRGFRIVG